MNTEPSKWWQRHESMVTRSMIIVGTVLVSGSLTWFFSTKKPQQPQIIRIEIKRPAKTATSVGEDAFDGTVQTMSAHHE